MTEDERNYLLLHHPSTLAALERGSRGAREWFDANRSAIGDDLKHNGPPDSVRVAEAERFRRECEGAAGW